MSLRWAMRSDRGRERENNEDYARGEPDDGLFVIADGMGGHIAGEVASHVAVDTLVEVVKRHGRPRRLSEELSLLGEAVLAAHHAVSQKAEELQLHGMGTTLTALRVRGRTATIAHVGDTRALLIQGHRIRPLTRDHTLVAMLIENGSLRPEEANRHPERHVLTQAVGPTTPIEPELVQLRLPRGSRVLLSTDGLHDVVQLEELAALASEPDLERAAELLVDRANALGGPDNVTVILIDA